MAENPQKLVGELSRKLHSNSWALIPGTGVAIKEGNKVFVPPGDVHLDRLETEDIFTFNSELDKAGNPELHQDATNPALNISAYTNLFVKVFQEFDCGCIIYAQPRAAVLVAELNKKFFKIKNNQMITQISNGETKEQYPWTHTLSVPIIENPDDQSKLFTKLEKAFEDNPQTNAVIIKGNGLFVCGDTWSETMTMFEALLYLFNTSLELGNVRQNEKSSEVVAALAKKANDIAALAKKAADVEDKIKTVKTTVANGKPASKPVVKEKIGSLFTAPRPARTSSFRDERREGGVLAYNELALRRKRLALARLRMSGASRGGYGAGVPRRSAASFMIGGSSDNSMEMAANQQNMRQQQEMAMMNQQMMNQQMMNQQMMNQQMANQNMRNPTVQNMENNFMQGGGSMDMGDNSKRSNSLFRSLSRKGASPMRGGRVLSRVGRGGRGGSVKDRLGFKSNISVDPAELRKGGGEVNIEEY